MNRTPETMEEEIDIPLPNGGFLSCGPTEDGGMFGQYVRICDKDGNEILYWDAQEWADDPILVMGAIFGAATTSIKELTKNRVLDTEERCWNLKPGKTQTGRRK